MDRKTQEKFSTGIWGEGIEQIELGSWMQVYMKIVVLILLFPHEFNFLFNLTYPIIFCDIKHW